MTARAGRVGSRVGRADLLAALVEGGEERLLAMARAIGARERPVAAMSPALPEPRAADLVGTGLIELGQDGLATRALRPAPFWRVVERRPREGLVPDEVDPSVVLEADDLEPQTDLPMTPELMPWRRVQRLLHADLAIWRSGREVDGDWLLDRAVRALPIERIRRRRVRRFPRRIWLIKDRSDRLLPTWDDQDALQLRLENCLGRAAVGVELLDDGPVSERLGRRGKLEPGMAVLALSDLGAAHHNARRHDWDRLGQALQRRGHRLAALLPFPRRRWPSDLATCWRPRVWDRRERSSLPGAPNWLALLAGQLSFVEPGLLRALRLLLGPDHADIGGELDLWNRAEERSYGGAVFDPADQARWAADLTAVLNRGEGAAILQAALDRIEHWRRARSALVRLDETVRQLGCLPEGGLAEPREVLLATIDHLASRIEGSLVGSATGSIVDPKALGRWVERAWNRLGQQPRDTDPGRRIERIWRLAREGLAASPSTWLLGQVGNRLVIERHPANGRADVPRTDRLRPLAELECGGRLVTIATGAGATRSGVLPVSHPLAAEVRIATDREELHLARFEAPPGVDRVGRGPGGLWVEAGGRSERVRFWWREPAGAAGRGRWELDPGTPLAWAKEAGVDGFGIWAEIVLGPARQRFRWVPGGSFIMGSPADEPGRDGDESQHEVSLDGFWLAEVPCSQALWEAVMDDNPSHFRSPDRPVEMVSWLDCETMMRKLAALIPGLEPRFPTEAEWECACRAGSTEATYAGPIEIRGENDAPVLDAIAWYGGNSGVGFELAGGADSSDWHDKQYPYGQAGSRPVGQKSPNELGLFDMLGNVDEWCADWYDSYPSGRSWNPPGPSSGVFRVDRGGSWNSDARNVRAASRDPRLPEITWHLQGFRLARG
ncbi:MAG: formylglycine-generating enzyme family protein [Planctomycetes bacterium]|nr:formylglycine-generating enzyme family protein [Planctomycetota bacterium]